MSIPVFRADRDLAITILQIDFKYHKTFANSSTKAWNEMCYTELFMRIELIETPSRNVTILLTIRPYALSPFGNALYGVI